MDSYGLGRSSSNRQGEALESRIKSPEKAGFSVVLPPGEPQLLKVSNYMKKYIESYFPVNTKVVLESVGPFKAEKVQGGRIVEMPRLFFIEFHMPSKEQIRYSFNNKTKEERLLFDSPGMLSTYRNDYSGQSYVELMRHGFSRKEEEYLKNRLLLYAGKPAEEFMEKYREIHEARHIPTKTNFNGYARITTLSSF